MHFVMDYWLSFINGQEYFDDFCLKPVLKLRSKKRKTIECQILKNEDTGFFSK